MKRMVLILLLVLLASYTSAAQIFTPSAHAGDGEAQTQYERGKDCLARGYYTEAANWFELAAAQGSAPARRDLAMLHQAGAGVVRDDAKALELMRQAAEQDDAEALFYLGFMYFDDKLAPLDYAQTEALWLKAAAFDFEPAAYSLGSFYYYGYGQAPDYVKSVRWFAKAHELGSSVAGYDLGMLYLYGIEGKPDQVLACEWFEKAAAVGNAEAKYVLGLIYFNGDGVTQDFAKARNYLEQVAEWEYSDGMYSLGLIYSQGLAGDVDYIRARECYESAAMQGHGPAQMDLGNIYHAGTGLEQADLGKAYMWFNLAAENDVAGAREKVDVLERELAVNEMGPAQVALARAYFFGMGHERDLVKAYARLLIAREYDTNVDEMLGTLRDLDDAERERGATMAQKWLDNSESFAR